MDPRNRTHVAIDPEYSYYWIFAVPSTATTSEEHLLEMGSIASSVLEVGNTFVQPTEIIYYERRYSDDDTPFDEGSSEPVETIENSIRDEDGVSVDSLVQALGVDDTGPVRIPEVRFDRCKVRIYLENGDSWIDRSEKCIPYRAGEPLDINGVRDPLTVKVQHATNIEHADLDADYVYYVWIKPQSDIWFEDTEIGSVNRGYLSSYLQDIHDEVSPALVLRDSDRVPEAELDEIF